VEWVFKGLLARSSRPGYPETEVTCQTVESWVKHVRYQGIRTIICVLGQDELVAYYRQLPRGLLYEYQEQGLEVEVIPLPDYSDPPVEAQQLTAVHKAYLRLPKPILIHCSAGMVRTEKAVRFLRQKIIVT